MESNIEMKKLWNIYQEKFKYAAEYTWDEIMLFVRELSLEAKLNVKKHLFLYDMDI